MKIVLNEDEIVDAIVSYVGERYWMSGDVLIRLKYVDGRYSAEVRTEREQRT